MPYAEMIEVVLQKAIPLNDLMQRSEQASGVLKAHLAEHGLQQEKVKFLPLAARIKDQTVLIDDTSGKVLGIVDIAPW